MASAVRARLLKVGVPVLALAALLTPAALAGNGGFTPVEPVTESSEGIWDTFLFVSIFALFIFLLVEVLLVAFVLRYRRRRRARFEDGAEIHGSTKLELMWTAFPVVVLTLIAFFVFLELPTVSDEPDAEAGGQPLEIQVVGQQYFFQYTYPNGVVAIDTMRVPAGVPVRLEITAPDRDVIHSWWIPALQGKIDAIPGTVNVLSFEADEPGLYEGQCAELCGVGHANMVTRADVMPAAEFDAWLADSRSQQTAGTSELGEETWEGVCAKCHGLGGEGGIGPRLAGSVLLRDADALSDIVRNGTGDMPPVGQDWSDEHIRALTSYLEENPPSGQ
jgi:cytochrome c oxidase subunit II